MTTSTTFLGSGAMGAALAGSALDAGLPTVVWNRSPGRTTAAGERGAVVADSLEEAVAGDGAVIVCLFDHGSVHSVLDPVGAALRGRDVINLTTTTPVESRELAAWAAERDIAYLDGAIMAVPAMIGRAGSAIFYSGSLATFERHRPLLDLWGTGSFHGPDAGMAALLDMAMLTGMYTMFAGFLHGAAMVTAAGVSATRFAEVQAPFLAAMTGQLAGFGAVVDAADYTGAGQQSLRFTETALATLLRATSDQGVALDVLQPVHEIVRRQIDAGFGGHGTARIFEELKGDR